MGSPLPATDLDCVRDLVRGSASAVGLVSLKDRAFLELSPAAASAIGLEESHDGPVDIGVIATDHELVLSLRVVAGDADESYAIALFSHSTYEEPRLEKPTLEALLGPMRDFGESSRGADIRLAPESIPGFEDLTGRQREILACLLHGDRVATISRRMHLSASTIRNHLSALYRKAGVHSQAELIEHLHAVTR